MNFCIFFIAPLSLLSALSTPCSKSCSILFHHRITRSVRRDQHCQRLQRVLVMFVNLASHKARLLCQRCKRSSDLVECAVLFSHDHLCVCDQPTGKTTTESRILTSCSARDHSAWSSSPPSSPPFPLPAKGWLDDEIGCAFEEAGPARREDDDDNEVEAYDWGDNSRKIQVH